MILQNKMHILWAVLCTTKVEVSKQAVFFFKECIHALCSLLNVVHILCNVE